MSGALLYLGVLMVTFLLGIPVALGLGGTSIILTLLERGVEGFSASFLAAIAAPMYVSQMNRKRDSSSVQGIEIVRTDRAMICRTTTHSKAKKIEIPSQSRMFFKTFIHYSFHPHQLDDR